MSKSFKSSSSSDTKTRRFPDGREGPANTPFCKVCYDAGLPSIEYTNHFVKSSVGPNGVVVCPTLLNQSCRICQQKGHTSSYCPQYRPRAPRVEEHPRYIEREREREHEHDNRRDNSFNRLREDTERHEREIQLRDDTYHREQDRHSKPWLQAALRPSSSSSQQHPPRERREPYAHPHGPRVRLELESRALSSATVAVVAVAAVPELPAIDVLKTGLHHASKWGDEEPEEMADEMFQQLAMENRHDDYISRDDDDLLTMSPRGGEIYGGCC